MLIRNGNSSEVDGYVGAHALCIFCTWRSRPLLNIDITDCIVGVQLKMNSVESCDIVFDWPLVYNKEIIWIDNYLVILYKLFLNVQNKFGM